MDRFETNLEIDQPPSRVFEFLADQENKPLWLSDFFKSEQLQGEQGEKGAVARQIFLNNGKQIAVMEEITDAHEGELFEETFRNDTADLRIRSEMKSDQEGKKTLLRVVIEYIPKSLWAKLRSLFSPNWLQKKYRRELANLKAAVEQLNS